MEIIVQEERTKQKKQVAPVMFLLTSLDKTNYDEFVTIIPKQSLESDIDKISYKWTASTILRGRCNTTNIMSLGPQLQKAVHKKRTC